MGVNGECLRRPMIYFVFINSLYMSRYSSPSSAGTQCNPFTQIGCKSIILGFSILDGFKQCR